MSRPWRILIVGADDADIERYKNGLSALDCRIATVSDADDAVPEVHAFSPCLVLLDAQIKTGDAFELCKQIKQDSVAMVVMVTALNELDDIQRAVDSGTDDFLSKPVASSELIKRVENVLNLYDCLP